MAEVVQKLVIEGPKTWRGGTKTCHRGAKNMARVVQKLVIEEPKTWQEWYNSLAIFIKYHNYTKNNDKPLESK